MKDSEISALIELKSPIIDNLTPFFDFPKRDVKKTRDKLAIIKTKEENFTNGAERSAKRISNKLKKLSSFYLDNFDIEDSLKPNGMDTYHQLIQSFSGLGMIPVTGLDRCSEHHDNIKDALKNKLFKYSKIALRLTYEDFENFELSKRNISDLFLDYLNEFKEVDLVIDCRLITTGEEKNISTLIIDFINKACAIFNFNKIIITGSIIPPSVSVIIDTNSYGFFKRSEIDIYKNVNSQVKKELFVGDYTCVSPDYSTADFYAEDMQNMMTGKVIYPINKDNLADYILFIRGSKLKTEKTQFCRLCNELVNNVGKPYFRGNTYSFGDNYLYECASRIKTNGTASTIVKPLVIAHIKYMFEISSIL